MSTSPEPEPPENAGPAGLRLWHDVLSEYRLSGADLEVLRRTVPMADQLDQLEAMIRAVGPIIRDRDGLPTANPAGVQHRLLANAQAKELASIRVIGDVDEPDGARPQKRSGVRGVYSLKAVE